MVAASLADPPDRFHSGTPVLFTRLHPAVHPGAREWIAWPALAWRVVAPDPSHRRPLDVFQRAVLRLAEAGAREAERVAALLGVERDLVAHLAAGLQAAGLLDPHGACTERGRRMLADDEDARDAPLISRHVFQDPWTGRLLDRTVEQLRHAEVEPQPEGRWPRLRFGSRGAPRQRPVFFIAPRDRDIQRHEPTAHDIMQALIGHAHAARDHEATRLGDSETIDGEDLPVPLLRRVSIVDDHPQPVFLVTWLYLPESAEDTGWRVADPFGLGDAYALRPAIVDQASRHPPLAERLARLTGEKLDALAANLTAWNTALDQQARERVTETLGVAAVGAPFEANLLEMERARIEFQTDPARAARAETAVLEAQKALEHALRVLLRQWRCPRDRVDRLSWDDRRRNAMLLDAIAADLGFTTPLPERLSRTGRGKVLSAITHGDASLGRQIAATLIAAEFHPDHPLRALAAQMPDAWHRVDAMTGARNAAAHANRSREPLPSDAIDAHITTTYALLAALMPRVSWR
ncbi:MAG: hypothetical protein R3F65_31510 [bacterium]